MKIINGDLFELVDQGDFDVIGHGCNCFCMQDAGIAKLMKEKYNTLDSKLEQLSYRGDLNKAGTIEVLPRINANNKRIYVANMYTQYNTGKNADIDFVFLALKKLFWYVSEKNKLRNTNLKIGLPMIGCGIGGINPVMILFLAESLLNIYDVDVTFVIRPGDFSDYYDVINTNYNSDLKL